MFFPEMAKWTQGRIGTLFYEINGLVQPLSLRSLSIEREKERLNPQTNQACPVMPVDDSFDRIRRAKGSCAKIDNKFGHTTLSSTQIY